MKNIPALQSAPRTDACDDMEQACIAAGCSTRRGATPDMSRILLRYWIELPSRSTEARSALLERILHGTLSGELSRQALVPFALGDPAYPVVARAVMHYVGCGLLSIERKSRLVHDAVDWVRRGLALNRAAVFAALLTTGDEEIMAHLGALRLLLDEREVSLVHSQFSDERRPAVTAFLTEWRELVTLGTSSAT